MATDQYVYPGTNILINKAGLQTHIELQKYERGVTSIRIHELRQQPIKGGYDLKHLQALHKHIFGDVYSWSGNIRDTDILKGSGDNRTVFTIKENIPDRGQELGRFIHDNNRLKGLDRGEFADKMGEVYAKLNIMHPFREGNGRASREFISQLAKEAGYSLDYSKIDKASWDKASIEASKGNLKPLQEVISTISISDRAVAFDKLDRKVALSKYPELDGAYKTLQITSQNGGDVGSIKKSISTILHTGEVVKSDVSLSESLRVMEAAAKDRNLMMRTADRLGGQYSGDVIATNSHHVMLKVGDSIAVLYQKNNLSRSVQVGEKLNILYDPNRSHVMQLAEHQHQKALDKGKDVLEHELGIPGRT